MKDLIRKDFENQEELYKFTKDNPGIKVKGIYTEEKKRKTDISYKLH